jgi:glutaredoxin
LAKEYFQSKGLVYTEYNVATDLAKRAEMVDMTGQMGVPVIKIDDAVMVGFSREAIDAYVSAADPASQSETLTGDGKEEVEKEDQENEEKGVIDQIKEFFG